MTIYIIIILLCIIGCFSDLFKSEARHLFFYFNLCVLFLVSILRYNIGVDYAVYAQAFDESLDIFNISIEYLTDNNIKNIEYGYLIFESIIKTFTDDFELFIIIYNIIMFYFFTAAITRNPYRNIQLFLLLCFIYPLYIIEAHRQAMAAAIFMYNIKNIIEKKLLSFLFFAFLGFMFHKLSLITLPFYFILNYSIANRKLVFFLLAIIFFMSFFDVIGSIIQYANDSFNYLEAIRRINHYYFIKNDPSLSNISFFAYLQRGILFFIIIAFFSKTKKEYNILIISYIFIFLVLANVGVMAGRVSGLFLVSYLYYFSNLFDSLNKNTHKFILLMFLILWGSSIFIKDLNTTHPEFGTFNYIPYKTILEKIR